MTGFAISSEGAKCISEAIDHLEKARAALDRIETGFDWPLETWSNFGEGAGRFDLVNERVVFKPRGCA